MDYSRFSRIAFDKAGLNSENARELAEQLEAAVLKELDKEVRASFEKIVSKLNEQGHTLTSYGNLGIGEYSYRGNEETSNNCGLRLACDVVISSGFSHIVA